MAALAVFLLAESLVPARLQPSARLCLWLIEGYQAVGSPLARAGGVQCKYQPSCSRYAHDAIAHFGTLRGGAKAAGRLWRCSPWGGCGYDPAVTRQGFFAAAFQEPAPQETPEERRRREEMEKAAKDLEKAMKELQEEAPKAAAGCALAGLGCIVTVVGSYVLIIVLMVWTYKDARARGDQNAAIWLILIFFAHLLGFVIYILARPKGTLLPCPNCRNNKLETLAKCPHCGAEAGPAKA
jgi:hypothetical protein